MKLGRPKVLNPPIRKQLITLATANQTNCRLQLTEIANLSGIQASPALYAKHLLRKVIIGVLHEFGLIFRQKLKKSELTGLTIMLTGPQLIGLR